MEIAACEPQKSASLLLLDGACNEVCVRNVRANRQSFGRPVISPGPNAWLDLDGRAAADLAGAGRCADTKRDVDLS